MVRLIWLRTHNFRLALNMLFCSVAFAPWGTLARETISGFLGRNELTPLFGWLADIVDRHFERKHGEIEHCATTYVLEEQARKILNP
jgi:hypothetical protein